MRVAHLNVHGLNCCLTLVQRCRHFISCVLSCQVWKQHDQLTLCLLNLPSLCSPRCPSVDIRCRHARGLEPLVYLYLLKLQFNYDCFCVGLCVSIACAACTSTCSPSVLLQLLFCFSGSRAAGISAPAALFRPAKAGERAMAVAVAVLLVL